jgi:isopentenyldiphosphate isomerase
VSNGQAQDPDELFDIVTFNGDPTGERKRRADIHRDGDWHRAIHVWVVSVIDGVAYLHVQRRSLHKDTSPGLLDPTVGGHLGSGETWRDALRETEEEIGLRVNETDLVYAGTRRGVGEGEPGIIDREIQDVFFGRRDVPLAAFRPNPAELSALVRVRIDDLLALFAGGRSEIPAESLDAISGDITQVEIARAEFGRQVDRYVYRVAISARQYLADERHFGV